MNHPLASSTGVSIDKNDSANSYWETALELLLALGTILHSLVIPLLVAIGVQFVVQFVVRVRHDAGRRLRRHAESLERDRLRLIEEIKIDLLKTLNKGGGGGGKAEGITLSKPPTTNGYQPADERRVSKKLTNGTSSPTGRTPGKTISGGTRSEATNKTPNNRDGDWIPRRLDRKECSNIVNEIIYQIQSGTRNNTGEDGSRQPGGGGGGGTLSGTTKGVDSRPGGNAEDSAILRDVHKRNVVARMKTLFEQQQNHPVDLQTPPVKRSPAADLPLRHFSSVVNILRRNESHGSSRSFSTSLENIRAQTSASGGGAGVQQFLKATSEPPTVIRLRRRIRSQQSLSESVEDILDSERFSKRLSQYSISDLLDEDDRRTSTKSPYDRVQKGLKTLSTFSLSELLQDDDEPETEAVDGGGGDDEVVLRRSAPQHSSQQRSPPAHYRNAVDNIEQILVAENLSKDYWKYSISNLLDFMEEDDGGVVCLQEYS